MSMPKLPEIDPEMNCENAISMILASIAMEEMALSHILNAESEKLQYVLGKLEAKRCGSADLAEIFRVNQSVTDLLNSVSQNQILLKNKMDKALYALERICPCKPEPPCPPPPCKCNGTFKAAEKCCTWCPYSSMHWQADNIDGSCICLDPCDKTSIQFSSKGRFIINFAVNVKTNSICMRGAEISLQMKKHHRSKSIFTVYCPVLANEIVTISGNGIIIDADCKDILPAISLKLMSSEKLLVENAFLSIVGI